MKTWTKEELYKPLEETSVEEFIQLKTKVDACTWRQTFHIQPITGLLNDPNGFSYFNGEYHLFYQWFPLGPVHGLKHWYHVKSKDLVHWENVGLGLKPEYDYENYGVYSGSAIEKDGQLHILYTGNHRDKNWKRKPMQALAKMNTQGIITKLENPVIDSVPQGYTEHFRDPKVWEENGTYYAVIGAQRENMTGAVVLYSSKDMTDWTFEGEIQTDYTDFGYMWECPDYFELDEKGLLLFSPQGIPAQNGRYQNIYQMGYLLGSPLDMEEKRLTHGEFQELDYGFDFYAAQTTLDEKGRRILIGWMGLPEINYPTDASGWAHCLSLPRELRVIEGKLYQTPVED
jgi:beta-fructofuranosidase